MNDREPMGSKIFISCGQNSSEERTAAHDISDWFRGQGYIPYVAIEVQSIPDLNYGIIGELKRSDYFLFINFRREEFITKAGAKSFRGSLYTNQELAIAYAMDFERMIFINQRGVERGGMFGTMVSNTPEFGDLSELLMTVKNAVAAALWSNNYSRHLDFVEYAWHGPLPFTDHVIWEGHSVPKRPVRMLTGQISNSRLDLGASHVVARLFRLTDSSGNSIAFNDPACLKVTSQQDAYSQPIWPRSSGRFDLLAVDHSDPKRVFLVSNHDMHPRKPIIKDWGKYLLTYQVFASGFPVLEFTLELSLAEGRDAEIRRISG